MRKKLDAFVRWINKRNNKVRHNPKLEITTYHKDYYTRPLSPSTNGLGRLKVLTGGGKTNE